MRRCAPNCAGGDEKSPRLCRAYGDFVHIDYALEYESPDVPPEIYDEDARHKREIGYIVHLEDDRCHQVIRIGMLPATQSRRVVTAPTPITCTKNTPMQIGCSLSSRCPEISCSASSKCPYVIMLWCACTMRLALFVNIPTQCRFPFDIPGTLR